MPDDMLRVRIIRRILNYSEIYRVEDLSDLSLNELKNMQGQTLIPLLVMWKYRKRHLR